MRRQGMQSRLFSQVSRHAAWIRKKRAGQKKSVNPRILLFFPFFVKAIQMIRIADLKKSILIQNYFKKFKLKFFCIGCKKELTSCFQKWSLKKVHASCMYFACCLELLHYSRWSMNNSLRDIWYRLIMEPDRHQSSLGRHLGRIK